MNTNAGRVCALLKTLAGRLGSSPESNAEFMLSEMTQSQEDNVLKLLQLMEETSRNLPVSEFSPEPQDLPEKQMPDQSEMLKQPEDGSYVPLSEHSAICRGCELGCELTWDDDGHYDGYSCVNGEETASLLAMLRQNSVK